MIADDLAMNQNLVPLRELFGNGRVYRVPPFQRDYAWGSEEWGDLWDDILALEKIAPEEPRQHYMGYIVLKPEKEAAHALIIDGQQRLATLSILARAVLRRLDDLVDAKINPKENKERRESLHRSFIGDQNPVSLQYHPRLHLNRRTDNFYRDHILKYEKPLHLATCRLPERRMWDALKFFYGELRTKFHDQDGAGEAIARFATEMLMDRLIFTVIRISRELDAYQVFETLNSRGAELSPADLVKNLLFQRADQLSGDNLGEMERLWSEIEDRIQRGAVTDFLRHYWNSCNSLVRKRGLYRKIRKQVNGDVRRAFEFVRDAQKAAAVYSGLQNPEEWPRGEDRSALRTLSIFRVQQHFSLLLAAYEKFSPHDFNRLLGVVETIFFRYNIVGDRRPSPLEIAYNDAALAIGRGAGFFAVKTALKKAVYVEDQNFKDDFATLEIRAGNKRDKALIRYILSRLEQGISGREIDLDSSKVTIEHILPQSSPENWNDNFPADKRDLYVSRIGNYCLLSDGENRKCADLSYSAKKPIYQKSGYKVTHEWMYDEWEPKALDKRQREMAKIAVRCWRID
jgi:hypothetical protein